MSQEPETSLGKEPPKQHNPIHEDFYPIQFRGSHKKVQTAADRYIRHACMYKHQHCDLRHILLSLANVLPLVVMAIVCRSCRSHAYFQKLYPGEDLLSRKAFAVVC